MQDVDNTDDYSVNMSDPNTAAPEEEFSDARDFTTADAGDQQTVIAMVILFVIFWSVLGLAVGVIVFKLKSIRGFQLTSLRPILFRSICGITLKISLLPGNVERSRVLERQQEREKKRTLETQRKIEKNIIIKVSPYFVRRCGRVLSSGTLYLHTSN